MTLERVSTGVTSFKINKSTGDDDYGNSVNKHSNAGVMVANGTTG